MESPQLTFHHSPSEAEGGRRCRQHPSLSAPFQQSNKKRDIVLEQQRPQVSSHTEPHIQQSLRAESEFQAIGSGTSAASEYWFPLSPKARKHKKLLCVLGGVQKRWKPGKEIQEVAMKPTVNITMGITAPSTAPSGILHTSKSIKELSDHTTKHWTKLLADLSCLCHQCASHQNDIFCSRSP